MRKRILYMDLLAGISALFVVYLHSTLTVFNFRTDASWFASLFIQSFFRWPVPVFFMLSGANLLAYRQRYSTRTFFTKRIRRVLIPFLVWSIIWFIYEYLKGWVPDFTLRHFIKLFLYNNVQNIFWFFYTIIGMYLCIPVLSLIAKRENKRMIQYFILICILQTGVVPLLFTIIHQPIPFYTALPIVGGFLSYVLTGWYLVQFPLKKHIRWIIYISGILSGICIFAGTYYFSLPMHQLNQIVFDYNSVFVYFLSVSVFVLFQSIKWECLIKPHMVKWLTVVSSTSFGVYLVHFFVKLELDQRLHLNESSIYYMTLNPIVIFVISVLLVFLFKRIPLVKHIMP